MDVTLHYLHAADHGQGKTGADTDVVRGRFRAAVPGERAAHETAMRSTLENLAAHVERSAATPAARRDADEDRR